MDSGNDHVTIKTACGSHLGYDEEEQAWCEYCIIALSVLMAINMFILLYCYRMSIFGKVRQLLDWLATRPGPGLRDVASTSQRPSTVPLTNLGPSTVIVNNIGVYGVDMKHPGPIATTRVKEPRVVTVQNPVFSTVDGALSCNGSDAMKVEDRRRKISVYMDRPLPALPEEPQEKLNVNEDTYCNAKKGVDNVIASAASILLKDKDDSDLTQQKENTGSARNNSKSGLYVDIELFI